MQKKLLVTDFRTAAFRNLNICKLMLAELDSSPGKKSIILHKVFYLSGYIVEFCYKYSLFQGLNLRKHDNVQNFSDDNFRKRWQNHSFTKLRILCSTYNIQFGSDIPYFGKKVNDKELEKYFDAWDVQVRYSMTLSSKPIELKEESLRNFLKLLEEMLNKIISKFS